MPSWTDLLPGANAVSKSILGGVDRIGDVSIHEPAANTMGEQGTWGSSKFVALGRAALGAYRGFTGAPIHGFMDVSDPAQIDDQEMAKMIAQYGAIPAHSDLGELAVAAGARTYKQRVKFNDGSSAVIDVVQIGSARGGADRPESGRPRAKRKSITPYRMGTAAWVMRKLHAQQRLGRRLAKVAKTLGA